MNNSLEIISIAFLLLTIAFCLIYLTNNRKLNTEKGGSLKIEKVSVSILNIIPKIFITVAILIVVFAIGYFKI